MPSSIRASDLQKAIDENNYLNDKSFKQLDVDAKIMVIRDGLTSHPRRKAALYYYTDWTTTNFSYLKF